MYTNLETVVSDLFESNIKGLAEVDNYDVNNLIRAYLRDEGYDAHEILEVLHNDDILHEFESMHNINLLNDYPFKKIFPHYTQREALICMTQLFTEFVCKYPGDLYSKFSLDFCKLFSKEVDEAFDHIVGDEYGRYHHKSYEDFEYSLYCKSGHLLGE